MSEPLKIKVIDKTNFKDIKSLKSLYTKFWIDIYIRNTPEYAGLSTAAQNEVINSAIQEFEKKRKPSILSSQDITDLKKDIQNNEILGQKSSSDIRYYIMTDNKNRIVAFQKAVVWTNKDGAIVGSRPEAYTEQDYTGLIGYAIDSKGKMHYSLYSKILYDDISNWFSENNVTIEETCTGINMLLNIEAYIRVMGFFPIFKDDIYIYFDKDMNHPFSKSVLNAVFKYYCQYKKEEKSNEQILSELDAIPEFSKLPKDYKARLASSFLGENYLNMFSEEEVGKSIITVSEELIKNSSIRLNKDLVDMRYRDSNFK